MDFLRALCLHLDLDVETAATACVYYHRCMSFCREKRNEMIDHPAEKKEEEIIWPASAFQLDPTLLVSGCVYLATKVREDMRKLRDVVNVSHCLLHPDVAYLPLNDAYWQLRDSIVTYELLILRLLDFELDVKLPFKTLVRTMEDGLHDHIRSENKDIVCFLKQTAYAVINDCFSTDLCLKFHRDDIALAALFLAIHCISSKSPATLDLLEKFSDQHRVKPKLIRDIAGELYGIDFSDEK